MAVGDFNIYMMSNPLTLEEMEGMLDSDVVRAFDILEEGGDGVGMVLNHVGDYSLFMIKARNMIESAEDVTIPAPPDCEISILPYEPSTQVVVPAGWIHGGGVILKVTRISTDYYDTKLSQWVASDPMNNSESNFVCHGGISFSPKLSDIASAESWESVPPVISGTLVATPLSSTAIQLSGPSAYDEHTGIYRWRVKVNDGNWSTVWQAVDEPPTESNFPTTVVNSLDPDTEYTFHVLARDYDNTSLILSATARTLAS